MTVLVEMIQSITHGRSPSTPDLVWRAWVWACFSVEAPARSGMNDAMSTFFYSARGAMERPCRSRLDRVIKGTLTS
jgi:hypothetical protein